MLSFQDVRTFFSHFFFLDPSHISVMKLYISLGGSKNANCMPSTRVLCWYLLCGGIINGQLIVQVGCLPSPRHVPNLEILAKSPEFSYDSP